MLRPIHSGEEFHTRRPSRQQFDGWRRSGSCSQDDKENSLETALGIELSFPQQFVNSSRIKTLLRAGRHCWIGQQIGGLSLAHEFLG